MFYPPYNVSTYLWKFMEEVSLQFIGNVKRWAIIKQNVYQQLFL